MNLVTEKPLTYSDRENEGAARGQLPPRTVQRPDRDTLLLPQGKILERFQ